MLIFHVSLNCYIDGEYLCMVVLMALLDYLCPVYLTAGDNNKAETVLSLFLQAVAEFGLPSRVRSDKGGGGGMWMYPCIC